MVDDNKFAFSPQKSKMSRRSFLTGGASTVARQAARGVMSAPEEEYYYDEYTGTAGKYKLAEGDENFVHHSTLPNGTEIHKNSYGGHELLKTKARSRAHAHSKFSQHTAYYGEPDWHDD